MSGRLRALWTKVRDRWAALQSSDAFHPTMTRFMRLPRPVSFVLIVTMFLLGWHDPTHFSVFADAMAKLPSEFWNVVMILLGSIAASKLIRDARE
jgi:hypothetical protein